MQSQFSGRVWRLQGRGLDWEEGKGAPGPTGSSFKGTGHTYRTERTKKNNKETKKAKPSYISRSASF